MSTDTIMALLADKYTTDDTQIYNCGHGSIAVSDLRELVKRAKQADAQVAAAYEAAAKTARTLRDICGLDQDGNPYVSEEAHLFGASVANDIADNIRALTPTDAKASLDRIVQKAVRDALENARGAVLAERLFDEISTSDHRAHNAALDSAVQAIAALKGGEQ